MTRTSTLLRATWLATAALLLGCASEPPARPADWLATLAAAPLPPAGDHLPLPPAAVVARIERAAWQIRRVAETEGGISGAQRIRVHFPEHGDTLDFKWKEALRGDADGWNNTPRKEIAAYALQDLLLPPARHVVPPTSVRCIPLADYRVLDDQPSPTLSDTRCVLGTAALWLRNVTIPEPLFDEDRFVRDGVYARHLANFNLVTHLIEHRDVPKPGNVLVSTDDENRRVFAVDNGIAFFGLFYIPFRGHWDRLRVPALPRDTVERLRRVDQRQLDALAVVVQLELDGAGILQHAPHGPPLDPARGARRRGDVFQLGLTASEIDELRERIDGLLRRIESGEVPLF